jgi:hypothetical protein
LDDTTGNYNTAVGLQALAYNTTGSYNTAAGLQALSGGLGADGLPGGTGFNNTGIGTYALYSYTTGSYNTAAGMNSLYYNSTGSNNTASGFNALYSNTTGSNNIGEGFQAGYYLTTGSNNIGEGFQAGYYLTTGSNNIDIGNPGAAADTGIIRIGVSGTQKATFIAGIYGASVHGHAVMISSTGRLGIMVSSERYKTSITPMGSNTAKLEQLRPVTFHLKTDPKGALQYGLIAEEVAKIYPELVIRDGTGRIDGVRYDELAPMLLNEVQQQQTTIAA